MKSLFQKTIISLLVLGIFLAPIGNRASQTLFAEETETVISPIVAVDITHDSGTFNITIKNAKSGYKTDSLGKNFNVFLYSKLPTSDPLIGLLDGKGFLIQDNKPSQEIEVTFKNTNNTTFLVANTVYFIKAQLQQGDQIFQTIISFKTDSSANTNDGAIVGEGTSEILEETTTTGGQYGSGTVTRIGAASLDFHCAIIGNGTVEGCFAMLIYKAFFVPLAFFTRLSANLLDFFVYYSTDSKPYQSDFIAKAWGVVRDIANIFFIITLLFVAIKTVLGLNVSNNKKLISYVIVIALVINFSLFTTRVIVDASNILAKIFYNNFTPIDETGKKLDPNSDGQKSITVGLVKTFDPVSIFGKTNKQIQNNYNNNIGTFIIITLFAIILMGFMIYIFLSVALLFLARTVGLWMQMIFSPLAFASYSVPFEIPGFGHKEWWTNLFKYAFLAPIFIFFLYIIFLLGDALNTVVFDVAEAGKNVDPIRALLDQFIKVTIPFAVIFVLLKQAKKLATQYAGEIGVAIQKAGSVVGGLALGATGLGIAAAGRATIGATAKYVQNDVARAKDLKFGNYAQWSPWKKANPFAYISQAGKTAAAAVATGIHKIPTPSGSTLGKKMQDADKGYSHKTHATHVLDAKMQSEYGHTYGKDAKFKDLAEYEQKIVKKEVDKDEMSKHIYGKQFKDLEAREAALIQGRYNNGERPVSDGHGGTLDVRPLLLNETAKSDYFVDTSKVNMAMGEFTQALRKGSYDLRSLSDMKAKSKGFFPKMIVGVSAAVATGMKFGLRQSLNIELGKPQKDLFKDLGSIIKESLKTINVKVDSGHGDDGHTKDVKSVGH